MSDDPIGEYKQHLYAAHHAASRDYDQAILTLAAGTLALSVTFASNIAPNPAEGSRDFLVWAWVSLGAALITIVLSFLTSQAAIRARIEALESDLALPRLVAIGERATLILNLAAGAGLVIGLGLLAAYALANI